MNIIINNIRQLRKNTPVLFAIIVIIQIMVSYSALYVIGSVSNDYFSLKEDRYSTLNLDIFFDTAKEDESVTFAELEGALFELEEGVLSNTISYIGANYERQENGGLYITTFIISDGIYYLGNAVENYVIGEGRNFTQTDYENGDFVALADNVNLPDEIEINGCLINVIGKFAYTGHLSENLYLSPETFKNVGLPLEMCEIFLNRILTKQELQDVETVLEKHLGSRYRVVLKTITNEDNNSILRSSILVSSVIAITSVSVLIMVYAYFLKLRKRNIAICRLTGCSKRKLILLLIGEMSMITLPFLFIGIILFDLSKRLFLIKLYPYIEITHTLKLYVLFGIALTIILLMILIVFVGIKASKSVRNQITDAEL